MKRFNIPGLVFLAAVAALWQAAAAARGSPNFPGFVEVVQALWTARTALQADLMISMGRAAAGFAIALAICLPLGIALGRIRALGDLAEPVIELVRPLPPIAIVPVAMIFLGTGGAAKIAVVAYAASFPILINAMEAVRTSHPMLTNVARSIRLTRAETMLSIDLPAALPQIMAGIRLSVAVALLIAVVAEMILSADGLGTYIIRAQERFQIANGLAAILLIALVALALNAAVLAIERRVLAWHHVRGALAARP